MQLSKPIAKAPPQADERYTVAWVCWIALFFAIEVPPIMRGQQQNTLSDHVWAWFGIPRHVGPTPNVRARRIALLGFMAWLASHFLTGDEV